MNDKLKQLFLKNSTCLRTKSYPYGIIVMDESQFQSAVAEMKKEGLFEKKCVWTTGEEYYDEDSQNDYYHTSCNNDFTFMNDGVLENHFKHCPYCGGVIQIEEEGK